MKGWLEAAVVVLSLLPAAWAVVLVVRDKGVDLALLVGAGVVELAVLLQLVVGVVAMLGSDRDIARGTFVGYLVGAVVVPPLGVAWAVGEKNRYGSAVLLAVFLVIPVMVLRLHGIWTGLHV